VVAGQGVAQAVPTWRRAPRNAAAAGRCRSYPRVPSSERGVVGLISRRLVRARPRKPAGHRAAFRGGRGSVLLAVAPPASVPGVPGMQGHGPAPGSDVPLVAPGVHEMRWVAPAPQVGRSVVPERSCGQADMG
jgi:hypothetical protein